jgi:hypothetical protein
LRLAIAWRLDVSNARLESMTHRIAIARPLTDTLVDDVDLSLGPQTGNHPGYFIMVDLHPLVPHEDNLVGVLKILLNHLQLRLCHLTLLLQLSNKLLLLFDHQHLVEIVVLLEIEASIRIKMLHIVDAVVSACRFAHCEFSSLNFSSFS